MTGVLTWARLSYRQQRWELWLVAAGAALLVGAMLWFAYTLNGLYAASPNCLAFVAEELDSLTGPPVGCGAILGEYYETQGRASNLLGIALVVPFGIGVILGAPLVAREIDGGTAQVAWSLSPSRVRWLLRRIGFVAVFGLLLLGVIAVTGEVLAAAIWPERTLGEDFVYFGMRGLPIVARGTGAMMLGVLVGALIGRVLPAVLASAVVIGIVFVGITFAQNAWAESEATIQRFYDDAGNAVPFDRAALDIEYGIETPEGEFVRDIGYPIDERGRVFASEEDLAVGRLLGHEVRLLVLGERYPELVLRDSVIAILVGAAALAAAAVVVTRRRPA
ncbi:MAG: hypothetical protein H0U86_12120 [Chloroflexi bacterium]|nr:hypothetical protein [Chloroflexota bacterium]